ncbi:MAG TPA: hypothetical protein VGC81_10360 [Candidatus Methylomirabilis sp.]
MPGREDFGKVRLNALDDPRIQEASKGLSVPAWGVCGLLGLLGGALARDGDDGVIRGDPEFFISRQAGVGNPKKALRVLTSAGLLEEAPEGLYLKGWRELYGSMITRREKDRERKAGQRSEAKTGPVHRKTSEVSGGQSAGHVTPSPNVEKRRVEESIKESSPYPLLGGHGNNGSDPFVPGSSAGSLLSSSALSTIALSGIRLHGRAGVSLAVWTGSIVSLLESGASLKDIIEVLLASKPCDPPHIALQDLQIRFGNRPRSSFGPPAQDPTVKAEYAAIDGDGKERKAR